MSQDLIQYLEKRIDKLETKLDSHANKVQDKLDDLYKFRWQIVGMSGLASVVLTILVQVVIAVMKVKA